MSEKVQYGACKYCGQIKPFEVDEDVTNEKMDEMATEECNCDEAKQAKKLKESEKRAERNIDKLFGQNDAGEILKAAVHSVATYGIESITVKVGSVKGELWLKNSEVMVKRTVTSTNTLGG